MLLASLWSPETYRIDSAGMRFRFWHTSGPSGSVRFGMAPQHRDRFLDPFNDASRRCYRIVRRNVFISAVEVGQLAASTELSLATASEGSGDLCLIGKLAGISLANAFSYMLDLPLMDIKVSILSLLPRLQPNAYRFAFHMSPSFARVLHQRQHQPRLAAWTARGIL